LQLTIYELCHAARQRQELIARRVDILAVFRILVSEGKDEERNDCDNDKQH
jgi:hypothetical protein